MQIITRQISSEYAASDAARNPDAQVGSSSAGTAAKAGGRAAAGIGVGLGMRPGGRMRVRLEPDTGADSPDSRSRTSAGVSEHGSGSRRNLLRGSRARGHRHGGGGHD